MFLGEARHALDDKGRVTLPAKARAAFAGGCVVTRGRDGCLWVFPESEWERVMDAFKGMSTADQNVRHTRRFFLGSASEETPDAQGRIRIPVTLRGHAELSKDVVITGEADRLEIWDAGRWDQMQPDIEEAVDAVGETTGLPI